MREFVYHISTHWEGNQGEGTKDFKSYNREFSVHAEGKPVLTGSADPSFKGDKTKWNPEELLLAALSTCHMLSYLYLCAAHGITVTSYIDHPTANMALDEKGKGYFTKAVLKPSIIVADPAKVGEAESLHEVAHSKCFIANSVNFEIEITPTFTESYV